MSEDTDPAAADKGNIVFGTHRDAHFRARYGPWALVAGAAEGLGAATAEHLAQLGLHLWLVDRQAAPLQATADRIRAAHGVPVQTDVLDFAEARAAQQLVQRASDLSAERPIGLVVYVAAAASIGPFVETPLADHEAVISVNCRAPVVLLHGLLPPMVARGRGGVLLFSSMAGFQGSGQVGSYAASKAFDLVLGESLGDELRETGVDVSVCCPGPTRTPAYVRSAPRVRPSPVMEPADVVRYALPRLGRRTVLIPGLFNRLSRMLLVLLGRRRAVALISRTTRKMYP